MREGGLVGWLSNLVVRPPDRAAGAAVHLATAPTLAGVSGDFFAGARGRDPGAYARDPAAQRRLWEVSAALAGLA